MLYRFNQAELKKPIQTLSEEYIIFKNVCKTRAVFICILIQLFTHITINALTNSIALTNQPSQMFINVCLLGVFVASGTACALISVNFMFWKWKLKHSSSVQAGLKIFRGVTGSIVPMTVESQVYFKQFQNAWS
uniref:Serpentine receptor class gamma n=1 Tax=Panagrellus redivivus TaxID=6233 RepID=A0A7E4UWI3_PANRE